MNVYEAITKRRSIRKFKDIPVPYNTLERCVNAARLAPAGKNFQLCAHIIVDDEQMLPQILDTVENWGGELKPADGWSPECRPTAYIVSLINSSLEAELGRTRAVTTCEVGMAAENIILVALEEGIGACPLLSFNKDELRRILNIPDKYDIALLLALGFPDESPVLEIATGSISYWVDSEGVRHIPKRGMKDVAFRNRFP